jgi:hypothetical protein
MPLGLTQEDVRAIAFTLQRHLRGGPEKVLPSTAWGAAPACAAEKVRAEAICCCTTCLLQMGAGPLVMFPAPGDVDCTTSCHQLGALSTGFRGT